MFALDMVNAFVQIFVHAQICTVVNDVNILSVSSYQQMILDVALVMVLVLLQKAVLVEKDGMVPIVISQFVDVDQMVFALNQKKIDAIADVNVE